MSKTIGQLPDGTRPTGEEYVESEQGGNSRKHRFGHLAGPFKVDVVATSNVDISTGLAAGQTLDGETLVAGWIVLLTAQTAGEENGVYVVPASGAASRHAAFAAYNDHPGALITVTRGTAGANTIWQCTSAPGGTIDVTDVDFEKKETYTQSGTDPIAMPYLTRMRFMLDMREFCAGDGTDEAAGILKAIDEAVTSGKDLIVAEKTFTAGSKITKAIGNKTLAMHFERGGAIKFTNAASAGFDFTLTAYDAVSGTVGRLFLTAPRIIPAAVCADAAIKATWSSWVANAESHYQIEDPYIGATIFGTNKFARGIHLDKAFNGKIIRPNVIGATSKGDAAIYLNNCISCGIDRPDASFYSKAIHVTTGDGGPAEEQSEGFRISDGYLYNVESGLWVDGNATSGVAAVDVHLQNVHISGGGAASARLVLFDKVQQSSVWGMVGYSDATLNSAIDLASCVGVDVVGNELISLGGPYASQVGIVARSSSRNNMIAGNHISAYLTPILFGAGADTANRYGGNEYDSCTNGLIDNGTANTQIAPDIRTTAGTVNSRTWAYPGTMQLPGQPSFSAYLAAATSNDKTGDGTAYVITGMTETFDQASNFDGQTFTAPVTGRYRFDLSVEMVNLAAGHDRGFVELVTSNRTYFFGIGSPGAMRSSSNECSIAGGVLADMDAGDTAFLRVTVSGSTKTVGIAGGGSVLTVFSGSLVG